MRFLQAKETVVRSWDNTAEQLVPPSRGVTNKRRRLNTPAKDTTEEETVISREHIKSLDQHLAPYPRQTLSQWQSLTSLIDETCLARVVGLDERGDALCDALTASTADVKEAQAGKSTAGPMTWGKPRPEAVSPVVSENPRKHEQDQVADDEAEEVLKFATFDLKRSWPADAVGEDLTRHSRDKSWLLNNTVNSQLGSGQPVPSFICTKLLIYRSYRPETAASGTAASLDLIHPRAQLCRPRILQASLHPHLSL